MIRLFFLYLWWHYTEALKNIFELVKNFLWFLYHFFSMPVLSRTLFSPWQKLAEHYKGGFDIQNFFESLIVTTIMRVVGFLIRTFILLAGGASLIFVFIFGIVFTLVWLVVPVLVLTMFLGGIRLII